MMFNFTKMQGIGNDYIYFDCTNSEFPNPEKAAQVLSDRHFGIGSDGIVLIEAASDPDTADFKMRMFNADGSEAEMCGNAVRCIAKYIYEKGLSHNKIINLETKAGVKVLNLRLKDDLVNQVQVNMGKPVWEPAKIPCNINQEPIIDYPLEIKNHKFLINVLSMGNPHCVIFVDNITNELVKVIGPEIEKHNIFPNKANVEFAKIHSSSLVQMRVWERGSGETLACGTGACAVVAAGVLTGKLDKITTVKLLGGELEIEVNNNEEILKTGPAEIVYEGEIRKCW